MAGTFRRRACRELQENVRLAKPNYGFEKRQRELAKKKKQDEKLAKKREARQAVENTPEAPVPAAAASTAPEPLAPQADAPRIHRRTPASGE